jgi:FixJ family two-component response regulator
MDSVTHDIPLIPPLPSSIRIWIAEDDEELREILGGALAGASREIRLFENGEEVLKALAGNDPLDILITDLVMPRVGGLELLKEAKARHPHCLVLLMTGYASLDTAVEAIRGGAYDYIRKPFKLDELKVIVHNACEKVALVRENEHLLNQLREAMEELKLLRGLWEEYQTALTNFHLIPFSKKLTELEVLFNQIPPDLELRRQAARDKTLDDLERLLDLKRQGAINENEFQSFKNILMRRLGERS